MIVVVIAAPIVCGALACVLSINQKKNIARATTEGALAPYLLLNDSNKLLCWWPKI
jgi:phosphoglycerol transferase MdoB-like AlkP superfamily enzyme